jgi:Domain of unknown function (DUF4149)
MRSHWAAALVTLALLWAGTVLGVAFIAVPAQFAAAIARPQGIDITRQVFTTFGRVELGLAAVTLVLALVVRPRRLLWALLALLWLTVALQSAWLLPVLDARADQLLQGQEPAAGPWHGLFVGSEITKLVALLLIAWVERPAARA